VNAFEQRLENNVTKAEALLRAASDRLKDALREYENEVSRHEERGDGFFPTFYIKARKEAVMARKHYEAKASQLNTAKAKRDAATLGVEFPEPGVVA
jgi:hypothetical protein